MKSVTPPHGLARFHLVSSAPTLSRLPPHGLASEYGLSAPDPSLSASTGPSLSARTHLAKMKSAWLRPTVLLCPCGCSGAGLLHFRFAWEQSKSCCPTAQGWLIRSFQAPKPVDQWQVYCKRMHFKGIVYCGTVGSIYMDQYLSSPALDRPGHCHFGLYEDALGLDFKPIPHIVASAGKKALL